MQMNMPSAVGLNSYKLQKYKKRNIVQNQVKFSMLSKHTVYRHLMQILELITRGNAQIRIGSFKFQY